MPRDPEKHRRNSLSSYRRRRDEINRARRLRTQQLHEIRKRLNARLIGALVGDAIDAGISIVSSADLRNPLFRTGNTYERLSDSNPP